MKKKQTNDVYRWGLKGMVILMVLPFVTGITECSRRYPLRPPRHNPSTLLSRARALFDRIPHRMPGSFGDTPAMVELGQQLYFENGMSVNKTQSCNDCHPIDRNAAGVDNLPTSPGAEGIFGPRNAPTVLNAGFQFVQFWDGRAADLVEQAKGPILNPIEMGMPDAQAVVDRVRDLGYEDDFNRAYPFDEEPLNYENIARSIAAFERTLITRNRFDWYLAGYEKALTDPQKKGLQLFIDKGCVQCHSGPVLGGQFYQKIGIFGEYPYLEEDDRGRYEVTHDTADLDVFKVPILREVALTGPYFHNGKVATLGEAVDLMARLQLNITLARDDIHAILRFLVVLSDLERTIAPPPAEAMRDNGVWVQKNIADVPDGPAKYGLELLTNTYTMIGPGAEDPEMRYSGNALACTNCHQESGTKQFGLSWQNVIHRYPVYRDRSGKEATIEDRINGCLQRSMNGKPMPEDSIEMQAIVAFFEWLSEDLPENLVGIGRPSLDYPNRRADLALGNEYYRIYCQSCHGTEGQGYSAPWENGASTIPPLWGQKTFNIGAGMHRMLTSAQFLRSNMPLGIPWDQPTVTAEEAYDLSGYFNSFERPTMADLEKDYPDLATKPIDTPYPPYADPFPQEQHQFGPFQPIKAYYQNRN